MLSGGCCQCPFPLNMERGYLHSLFVDLWGWPVWLVDFDFPMLFWLVFRQQLGTLHVYSCAGGLLFFFFPCFLYVKGCEENLLWQLASWSSVVFVIYFCKPTLGDFLRAAVINRNPRLCELEVLVSLFGQVVVTGNVYRRLRFLKHISGSWESQNPGLWIRVNCSWANT